MIILTYKQTVSVVPNELIVLRQERDQVCFHATPRLESEAVSEMYYYRSSLRNLHLFVLTMRETRIINNLVRAVLLEI